MESPNNNTQSVTPNEATVTSAAPTPKHSNTAFIILLAAAAVIILVLLASIIYLIFRSNNSSSTSDNNILNTPSATSAPTSTVAPTPTTIVTVTSTTAVMVCGSTIDTLVLSSETTGKSALEVDTLLSERWLGQFKSSSRCMAERLDDYRIEKVTVSNADNFTLTYAVAPSDMNSSNWLAGNGVQDGTFIVHKFAFVSIKHTSTGIGIESIGTGP